VETARTNLMDQLQLTQVQAQAILDMQLRRLAALEREKLEDEHKELVQTIAGLEDLLSSPAKILAKVQEETRQIKQDFGDDRRTVIQEDEVGEESEEDRIAHQNLLVTLSQRGYIKRVPAETYRTQHRGGKGVRGMTTREDDALRELHVVDTHNILLFFTNRGRVYPLKAYQIPSDTSRTTRGTLLINLLPLAPGEQVQAMLPVKSVKEEDLLILGTRLGEVKALRMAELANIRAAGLITMDLEDKDELVGVSPLGQAEDVIMVSETGQSIRFPVTDLTPRSRSAGGVRGMRLAEGDRVVAMGTVTPDSHLLVVSRSGYGKSTPLSQYRRQSRGGSGILTFRVTEKTGPVAAAQVVESTEGQEIFVISAKAQVVRINLEDVRVAGRNTQGVIIWRDRDPEDTLASIACFQETQPESQPEPEPAPLAPAANGRSGRRPPGKAAAKG
jgi:DNA gyrase subunit A